MINLVGKIYRYIHQQLPAGENNIEGQYIFSDFSIDEILSALVDEENSLEFFELFLELVYSLK